MMVDKAMTRTSKTHTTRVASLCYTVQHAHPPTDLEEKQKTHTQSVLFALFFRSSEASQNLLRSFSQPLRDELRGKG